MITIGQLDRKILIFKKDSSQDALGGQDVGWELATGDEIPISCFIEFKSGKETDNNEHLNEEEVVIFYIRNIGSAVKRINAYDYRFTAGGLIIDTTEYYYPIVVQEYEGRNRFLKITTNKRTQELTRL